MRILGIDPGLRGGVAVLERRDNAPWLLGVADIPLLGIGAKRRVDVLQLRAWIDVHRPAMAFIERAGVMPKQGISSGFIYGRAVGALETAVMLAHLPLEIVEPAVWKRRFGLIGADKEMARRAVLALLPAYAEHFERVKDHGRAEAVLIAMFGADLLRERGQAA